MGSSYGDKKRYVRDLMSFKISVHVLANSLIEDRMMPDENDNDIQNTFDGTALAESLLKRCHHLLAELEEFRTFLEQQRTEQESAVEIRKFQQSVGSELKSLQKVFTFLESLDLKD